MLASFAIRFANHHEQSPTWIYPRKKQQGGPLGDVCVVILSPPAATTTDANDDGAPEEGTGEQGPMEVIITGISLISPREMVVNMS